MKVFASGSCRLLRVISGGWITAENDFHRSDKVKPIHCMFYNFIGINFLGKLHNTKQHIQFIKFIKDEIILPEYILKKFLTSYGGLNGKLTYCEDLSLLPIKKENIKREFDNCEWYLFEICSLKLYKKHGFEIQQEVTCDYDNVIIQSEEELYSDLCIIRNMIPLNKKILFQVHFRPNVIFKNKKREIKNREIIYNVVNKFCEKTANTFIYDPSGLIENDVKLFDGDVHFRPCGYKRSFDYIYNNFLSV